MISVIVGLYNEEEGLPSFIETFFKDIKLKEDFELILVDDGSIDNTKNIILKFRKKYPKIKLICYRPNRGLGNALRIGFKHAKGRIIVTLDSDLAHPPKYIRQLIETVDRGYDLVVCSRYFKGAGISGVPYHKAFLSKLSNIVTRTVIMTSISDVTSGFRAYNVNKLKKVVSKEKGFEVEVELLVKLLKKRAKIKEIPFKSQDRKVGESKFNVLTDGLGYSLRILKIMLYRWL